MAEAKEPEVVLLTEVNASSDGAVCREFYTVKAGYGIIEALSALSNVHVQFLDLEGQPTAVFLDVEPYAMCDWEVKDGPTAEGLVRVALQEVKVNPLARTVLVEDK